MLISLSKMIFLEKGSLLQVRQQVGEGGRSKKEGIVVKRKILITFLQIIIS